MTESRFLPLATYAELQPDVMQRRVDDFEAQLQRRRSVRQFSSRPVPRAIIEKCLLAAGSAPSGANQQPWYFVAIADPAIKARIRAAAEAAEHEFYERRAPQEWKDALEPLGTDEHKPYLETAPWLIAVFLQRYSRRPDGRKVKHYYTDESVGIALGLLIAAVHTAGLVSLTHTPSPMGFLADILGRPKDLERPYMLLVVGYPDPQASVPDIVRKPLAAIAEFLPPA
jgi:nitroreductase